MSESCSWIFSKRRWITPPKPTTTGGRSTIGIIAYSVSRGEIETMKASAIAKPTAVLTAYITAGPAA